VIEIIVFKYIISTVQREADREGIEPE